MTDNSLHAQYDITKKTKFRKFYDDNKTIIFAGVIILIISIIGFAFYFQKIEQKKVFLSDNYVEAKIYLKNGDKVKAKDVLEKIIYENDSTYSVLSLFLILNKKLVEDKNEIINLFDHLLENNKFEEEIEYLIILKKSLFLSSFSDESEMLDVLKPLINSETLWKPHALLLCGDYFISKNEPLKAQEFYKQVLSMKNLNRELYEHAQSQLMSIINE